MKTRVISLLLTFFTALTFAPLTLAQDYMGMFNASNTAGVNIAGTIAVNSAIKKQSKNAQAGKKSGTPADADTSRQRAVERLASHAVETLTYTPDPVVSRRVKTEFTKAVQQADPTKADHIANVMASQDVLSDFNRDMGPYRLRSTNIADAMTAYWVTMWMIANQEAIPAPERVAAARRQVTTNMMSNPMLAKATIEQRQEMAEGLVYETMFALGQRADAERRRDRTKQRDMAQSTQANLLKNGVDLQGLQLTDRGFHQ